jgi:DNA polymerase
VNREDKEILYNLFDTANRMLSNGTVPRGAMPAFSDDGSNSLPDAATEPVSAIAARIASCTLCDLCKTRTNTVPGIGVERPIVLVIGEGPGADEDAKGEPFVGKAGQLLDKMLSAIDLSRDTNCYIANVVKCRPPMNRDPLPEEAAACAPYLAAQIDALKPRAILAVGRIAAQNLLGTTSGIGQLRGRFFDYHGIPLMPTYHPSALLRDETLKRPAWEDLKKFKTELLDSGND